MKKDWNNEEFVLEAVKQDGDSLYYASTRLQDNGQIVLEAVKKNGLSLYFASYRLKDNEQIVLEAVKQDGDSLYHASKRLQDNEQFVLEAVKNSNDIEHFWKNFISEKMQKNSKVKIAYLVKIGKIKKVTENLLI